MFSRLLFYVFIYLLAHFLWKQSISRAAIASSCASATRACLSSHLFFGAHYIILYGCYTGLVFAICSKLFFFPPDFFSFSFFLPPLEPREERRARASACGGGSDFIGSGRAHSPPSHAAQLRSARLHEPLYKELNLPNFTLFPERSQLARRGGVRGL